MLSSEEASILLARRVPLDASFVPDDIFRQAAAEGRVWSEYAFSSMGTADLHWTPVSVETPLASARADSIVLPRDAPDPWPTFEHSLDDRDAIGRLWEPFWSDQSRQLAAAIPEARHDAMLEECARMLIELERDRPLARAKDETRTARDTLVDWLITGGGLDRDQLAAELAHHPQASISHLVTGVRARWLTRDVHAAIAAVVASAQRSDTRYDRTHAHAARLALLRFAARVA